MVFSSIPLYLDPHNWQQQQIQNQAGGQHGNSCETPPQLSLPPQPPSQFPGSSGSIRPGSMTDRARLAKLPQPEAGLKCPRCESTNTKFCYFNNYNRSQPRHFCKTCRRYWTKGGALRNVPVGGGCRRNKRSKSSSKSPITTSTIDRQTGSNITTSPSPISSSSNTDQIATNFTQPPPHFPLITSLQGLSQYSSGNLGLSFGGTIVGGSQSELGFQVGSSNNNNTSSDHQQVQNFSNFLSGFDSSNSGLYQFQTEGTEPPSQPSSSVLGNAQQLRYLPSSSSAQDGQQHQLSSQAKSEENQQGLNLSSRPFTSMAENTQYWAGNNSWMNNFSGLNSSSSSHFS